MDLEAFPGAATTMRLDVLADRVDTSCEALSIAAGRLLDFAPQRRMSAFCG